MRINKKNNLDAKKTPLGKMKKTLHFLLFFSSLLSFVPFSPWFPEEGLDASWVYAVNQAVKHSLVFGRDFIFTYGPLGYVSTLQYSPETDVRMLMYNVILGASFLISLYFFAPEKRRFLLLALPFFIPVILYRESIFLTIPFLILLPFARMVLPESSEYNLRMKPANIFMLAVCLYALSSLPMIKFSFAVSVFFIAGLIFIILCMRSCKVALGFSLFFLASLCVNWIFSGQKIQDLPVYFVGNFPIVSAYTNAMSHSGRNVGAIFSIMVSGAIFCVFFHAIRPVFGALSWILAFGMAVILFLSFKAGFTRQDEWHVYNTLYVFLILAYAASFYVKPWAGVFLLVVSALAFTMVKESKIDWTPDRIVEKISSHYKGLFHSIKVRWAYGMEFKDKYDVAKGNIRKNHPLPPVNGAVDLYPENLALIFAHDLPWSGRPVPQSYSAYSATLDEKNAQHLRSPRAPDTVFFSLDSSLENFPTMHDARSVLELLAAYDVYDIHGSYVVLRRHDRSPAAKLNVESARAFHAKLGSLINLEPTHSALWMQAKIKPTFFGKMASFLFKSKSLHIKITLNSGRVVEHKVLPEIAASGFIVSPYISDAESFVSLATGNAESWQKVKSVGFFSKKEFWHEDFDVTVTPVDIIAQNSLNHSALPARCLNGSGGLPATPLNAPAPSCAPARLRQSGAP